MVHLEGAQIDTLHSLDHEVPQIIRRDPVSKIGRKQKRLLPITVHEVAHAAILREIQPKVRQTASFTVEVWNASTVRGLAGAPEVLSAAAHRSTRSDLAWTAPANEGLSANSGYRIEWSADGNALDRAGGGHRQHGDYRRFGAAGRLESEIGYGIAMFDGGITGTPNVGFGLSDRARDYRLGWRPTPALRGDRRFAIDLDATRVLPIRTVWLDSTADPTRITDSDLDARSRVREPILEIPLTDQASVARVGMSRRRRARAGPSRSISRSRPDRSSQRQGCPERHVCPILVRCAARTKT